MRKLATPDGTIENGRVTPVYILVPDAETLSARYIASPHLADPHQAKDFQMEVIEDATEPGV